MNEQFDPDKTAIGGAYLGEATQMVMEPRADATQYAANVECPVCHTPNPPSETYCTDCGFMLTAAPVVVENIAAPSLGKLASTDGTREFCLNPGENTIGRENCDVLISHNTVSRKHARITIDGLKAFVEDLGSTNGTYVDSVRLSDGEKVELTDGSEVMFGSLSLKYSPPAAPEAEQVSDAPEPIPEKAEMVEVDVSEAVDAEPSPETAEEESFTKPAEVVAEEPEKLPIAKLSAKDGSLTFDVFEGTTTVGRRAGSNVIVIPDPYCSGRHADLRAEENGQMTVTDVGSTNGTFVNGVRLEDGVAKEISSGDEVTFGQTAFRIEVS